MHIDPTDPTDPTDPPVASDPTQPAAEPATEPVAEPAPPASPPDPAQERAIALDALNWCREHPSEETAVETLNAVFTLIREPEVRPAWIAAVRDVVLAIAQVPDPTPALHAHMTVLVANLLELSTDSAMVDELLVAWLRHPRSFGGLHTTPAAFQRESFVQRLGDLLGWSALDLHRDRDALRRFAEWVNTWNPRNKFRSRRALQALARNFPASDVWARIHLPSDNGPAPHRSSQGRRGDHDRPTSVPAASPAGATDPAPEGEPASPDAAPAPEAPAGEATKRKRRRKRRRKGAKPGEPGAVTAEGEGSAPAEGATDDGPDEGPDDAPEAEAEAAG